MRDPSLPLSPDGGFNAGGNYVRSVWGGRENGPRPSKQSVPATAFYRRSVTQRKGAFSHPGRKPGNQQAANLLARRAGGRSIPKLVKQTSNFKGLDLSTALHRDSECVGKDTTLLVGRIHANSYANGYIPYTVEAFGQ